MSFPVIIDSTNFVSSNSFKVNLANSTDLSQFDVSVSQALIPYSWDSINATPLNNNRFQLTIPTSGAEVVTTITVPDGAYQISDLNNYLQWWFISNGYYITNTATGLNTYYAALVVSTTSYSVQYITSPLPTSLPAGYTSGGMTFPAAANQHIQITMMTGSNFNLILGYTAGSTSPTVSTNVGIQTKNSNFAPIVNPVSAVQMRLSCVSTPLSDNNQLIHLFANGNTAFGAQIDASPLYNQPVPCNGSHREIILSFYDQHGVFLNMRDRDVKIKLMFTRRLN